ERNRYALARMLLHPSNFLLLDEPTNHLDLRAKDVLLNALQEFNGTVVFVSHDRYFIDKLATRVFEVADQRIEVFPGNYEDYLWRKQRVSQGQTSEAAPAPPVQSTSWPSANLASNGSEPAAAPNTSEAGRQKRVNPIKLRQMKERCSEIEEEITRVEAGIAECETGLQTFVSAEETTRLTDLLALRKKQLQELLAEWEELSGALEISG
ncbi:MAG TPA: ABC transporter ATP-binding protein, partial [Terriglobales bacterium]